MDFASIMQQITRPYWSPVHPHRYLKKTQGVVIGWGRLYPEDIGAFNLFWLVSGVGGPPDNYDRFMPSVQRVSMFLNHPIRGRRMSDLAALRPLDEFSRVLNSVVYQRELAFLYAVLRLRV